MHLIDGVLDPVGGAAVRMAALSPAQLVAKFGVSSGVNILFTPDIATGASNTPPGNPTPPSSQSAADP